MYVNIYNNYLSNSISYEDLLYKSKFFMPVPYYLILKSYLENQSFMIWQGNDLLSTHPIYARVPQHSDLSLNLYIFQ